ncbi:methyltransferase [Acidianus infernus]|uniref:tRNA (guanine(10)-N(2))-dimethyltransferase n=1 Tax=Acidianus infernus TaxID=12915 RepID=A0A6A9QAV8_ACIIN|nr:TRM11 family methyltransferase [Acidianus infernus]MUM64039.1 methyltransferase [Acidianus infernus]
MKYAILSADELFISLAELKALLKRPFSYVTGVAIFDGEAKNIARRSSTIKAIGEILAISDNPKDINDALKGKCFSIKPNVIMNSDKDLFPVLYKEIVDGIQFSKKCDKLDLIFTDGIILAGIRQEERDSKSLQAHAKKPYSQSGTMDAYTSRLLVNLANPDKTILDPFAGVGSILIEASWLGYDCIGGDIDSKMIEKTKYNLKYFNYECQIIQEDISNLPIKENSVDAIVTDPPYGRSVNARDVKFDELYESLFFNSAEILKKGGKLVFATDSKFDWRDKIKSSGLKVDSIHFIYLHKSLSRGIYVVEKP